MRRWDERMETIRIGGVVLALAMLVLKILAVGLVFCELII